MRNSYKLLDRFLERKCEVTFHLLTDDSLSATYVYDSFYYKLDDDYICFKDKIQNECDLSIELDKIISVVNLTDDIYKDVVIFKTSKYIISVCTLEERFIYPRCHKCHKEILVPEENLWSIHGGVNYGNHYEGNEYEIIKNLAFCDDCIANFIGEVGEYYA